MNNKMQRRDNESKKKTRKKTELEKRTAMKQWNEAMKQ